MKDASFSWGAKEETENSPLSPIVFFFLTYAFSSYAFLHNFCCTSYEVSVQFSSVAQSCPTLFFPSIRVFSNESGLHIRWPKYWSFRLKINATNKHPRLIPDLQPSLFSWVPVLESPAEPGPAKGR